MKRRVLRSIIFCWPGNLGLPSTAAGGRRREQTGLIQRISSNKYRIIVFYRIFFKTYFNLYKEYTLLTLKVLLSHQVSFGNQILLISDIYIFTAILNFMLKYMSTVFYIHFIEVKTHVKWQWYKTKEILVLVHSVHQLIFIEVHEVLELCTSWEAEIIYFTLHLDNTHLDFKRRETQMKMQAVE